MLTSALFVSWALVGQSVQAVGELPANARAPAAAASPAADLAPAVRRWVRQLDDEQLAKREAAEKALVDLGPVALDHLPPITKSTPAEVKDRLARVRRTLEAAAVEAATKPSLVTLHGEMSLEDALAALEKQTGNKIHDFRRRFGQQPRDITVKVDCDKKTFWEALDQVLDQAQMTVYNFGGQAGAVAIVAREEGELPRSGRAAYSGMFRFEGTRLDAVRDLRNPMNHALRIALDVAWEPRLNPIVLQQPLDDLKATDEAGHVIPVDGREGEIEATTESDTAATELFLPLTLPARSVKEIATLQGKLTVMAPGRIETFEFAELDKARDVEQRRAGVAVVLEQLRKNVDVFEIRIRVKFDKAANALESHRGWIYNNPAYLLDSQGNIVENAGLEATRQEIDEVGLSYKFVLDKGPAGHKFVYKTPAAIVKLPVEYELKHIELP